MRIVEALTDEAILNDFVHIEGESRTSTAVVDPTGGTYTEINEWGPASARRSSSTLLEKLRYLSQGARARRVRRLASARRRRRLLRRGDPRARARHVPSVLDSEGEPLRLGVEAEPFLVSPNQREAEALVGQEFHDEEDFRLALDGIAELGAATC